VIFAGAMGTRDRERRFVERTFGRHDPGFFGKNCGSCHLSGCLDCHGKDGHRVALPGKEACLSCHKGYFVGVDYFGRAPREENHRYQRGRLHGGEPYLKMLPDVHAEAGLPCGACHTMKSLAAGRKSAKGCRDCHVPSREVVEHRISSHIERLECYACHSAWASQEYGTFFLRFVDSPKKEFFLLRGRKGEYVRSVYLKKQDAPPLGVNASGRIAPIRPQFIAFYTEVRGDRPKGKENRLLAAEWKAFFPHTVRRETAACDGCHGNPRRFLLENPGERIYLPDRDGMELLSFWNRTGQRVANGDFIDLSSFLRMSAKSPAYKKGYVEKWKRLTGFEGD